MIDANSLEAIQIIVFILSIVVIFLVLLQGGKVQGLGQALTGASDANLFQQSKERTSEIVFKYVIFGIVAIIFVIAIVSARLFRAESPITTQMFINNGITLILN